MHIQCCTIIAGGIVRHAKQTSSVSNFGTIL